MSEDLLTVRRSRPEDENYIYETWLGDLRESDPSFLPNDLWFPAHRECIRRVLAGQNTQVFVLCDSQDEDLIIGYLVIDNNYLHWIHIRRGEWRNRGLAKHLLVQAGAQKHIKVWRTKGGHEKLSNKLDSRRAARAWWSRVAQLESS